jgi:hypothetical protein
VLTQAPTQILDDLIDLGRARAREEKQISSASARSWRNDEIFRKEFWFSRRCHSVKLDGLHDGAPAFERDE